MILYIERERKWEMITICLFNIHHHTEFQFFLSGPDGQTYTACVLWGKDKLFSVRAGCYFIYSQGYRRKLMGSWHSSQGICVEWNLGCHDPSTCIGAVQRLGTRLLSWLGGLPRSTPPSMQAGEKQPHYLPTDLSLDTFTFLSPPWHCSCPSTLQSGTAESRERCNGGDVSIERVQTGHLNTKGSDGWFPLSVVFSIYSPIFLSCVLSFEANIEG